jgi:uncharacterized protein (TIGR02145 family)
MAGETFQLRFRNNEDTYLSIDEPINFATVDFQLSQKDKGYGRDVSFNGGEVQFEFVKYRNHYLDKLLLYNNTYGFESIVELIITTVVSPPTIIGELDFATAITDDFEYFKCKVIQQSSKQIVKRRKAVKVDLLSDKDIDGNTITPLATENTLLTSKPIYLVSKWESDRTKDGSKYIWNAHEQGQGVSNQYIYVKNPVLLKLHELENALTNSNLYSRNDSSKTVYLKAATTLKNVVITLPAVFNQWVIRFPFGSDANIYATYQYVIEYPNNRIVLKSNVFNVEGETYSFNEELTHTIPSLNVNDEIKIYEYWDVRMGVDYNYYEVNLYQTVGIQKIIIEAESTTFKSVAPSFRLIDVMRQVVKSISGLDILAPRFDVGGEFYDNRLLNGNSLRAISTKPFYISLEDLEQSLIELNVDWEIDANGDIFFGTEDDFYTESIAYAFSNTQFSSFNKSFNPKFSINEFNYGYKNFQSLKENEEVNSADVVHGESKWVLGNKMVENKKDISIEWIRDAFLIETNRRKALSENVSENTASQDDDKLFALDTYKTQSEVTISGQYTLAHEYNPTTDILSLINDTSLNFVVTGIREGTYFQIVSPSVNQNTYRVDSVSPSTLKLIRVTTGAIASYTAIQAGTTSFNYKLTVSDIPYTIYTNNGFTNLDNLIASDLYSNLRYSIRRNIEKYWKKYLATCNLYHKTQGLSTTWYKNNTDFSATYGGLTLTEKEVIDTYAINPILTPFMYNDVIFANVEFSEFMALQDNIRTNRGYIKTYDNNGDELKLYPTTMKYDNLSKELNIKGEEKYTPTTLVQIAPVLTTNLASSITGSSAVSGGYIKTNGGSAITAKGIVWSLSTNPTIALTTKTNDGSGSVDYKSLLNGLYPSRKYYVKSYATNAIGTSYGNQEEFVAGYDGVTIGSQTWANKNLNVPTYSDGTVIPNMTLGTDWNNATVGAWCWFNHDSSVEQPYGKLYNWYAIAGIHDAASLTNTALRKKIAPDGWRIPSVTDFNTLIATAGGSSVAGKKLKSEQWTNVPNIPAVAGTDDYGFTAFGGGYRDIVPASPIPFYFKDFNWRCRFWTTTAQNSNNSSYVQLYADSDNMLVDNAGVDNKIGMSVRLIKD